MENTNETYSYKTNFNNGYDYCSNNFYIYNLNQLIDNYTKEKNNIEKDILKLKLINTDLFKHISFFDKKYCLVNITHSNTTNFIMANYKSLQYVLNKLIFIYDNNLDLINAKKEKLYNINVTINTLKFNTR